jgi:hypothetical protein
MFNIKVVFVGIMIAALLLLMAAIVHATGWMAALKMASILVMTVASLALIGLAIYGLGLVGMGLLTLIFALPLILFGKMKSGVTALFRRG